MENLMKEHKKLSEEEEKEKRPNYESELKQLEDYKNNPLSDDMLKQLDFYQREDRCHRMDHIWWIDCLTCRKHRKAQLEGDD